MPESTPEAAANARPARVNERAWAGVGVDDKMTGDAIKSSSYEGEEGRVMCEGRDWK